MHISVRGIVEKDDGIILIHRIKPQEDGTLRDYYVVPGGKQEEGESNLDTLNREIEEELGIKVKVKEKLIEYNDLAYNDSIQIFYICTHKNGIIGTGTGPEIVNKNEYKGIFQPTIVKYEDIKNVNLVPEYIKEILVKRYGEIKSEKKL
jgi:8-oxo-dGTP pyrophosphatase MutT (NUDIX family)